MSQRRMRHCGRNLASEPSTRNCGIGGAGSGGGAGEASLSCGMFLTGGASGFVASAGAGCINSSTLSTSGDVALAQKSEAELLSRKAGLAKAKVDVSVARADLTVAESEARRLKAWVGYLTLPAPYDGVIVARNANTGDFVLPLAGAAVRQLNGRPGELWGAESGQDRLVVVRH